MTINTEKRLVRTKLIDSANPGFHYHEITMCDRLFDDDIQMITNKNSDFRSAGIYRSFSFIKEQEEKFAIEEMVKTVEKKIEALQELQRNLLAASQKPTMIEENL